MQVDGYDLGRLQSEVGYEENDTNLDATTPPVPEPADPIDPLGR